MVESLRVGRSMEEWYYTRNGEQQGPVSLGALRDMAENGSLQPDDMVWNSSMSDWTPASQIDGIFSRAVGGTQAATPPTLDPEAVKPVELEEIEPGSDPLEIGRIFSRTFELTKQHFLTLLLTGLIVFGISAAFSIIMQVIMAVGGAAAGPSQTSFQTFQGPDGFEEFAYQSAAPAAGLSAGLLIIYLFFQILSSVVNLYLSLGMTRICLNIVDRKEAAIPMLFGEAGKLLRAVGASILCFIFVMVGLLLLIIPGIYLALKLSAVIPAIVDRNMGVMDAINYSFRITKGNCWMILLLWFVAVILMIIAIVITCGMGAIIVGPVFTLGWVLCYRWMQYGHQVSE